LGSTTTSQHLKIEPAVMASEIERLPDLAGFLKLASCPDWHSITLRPGGQPLSGRACRANVATTPPHVPPTHASHEPVQNRSDGAQSPHPPP